MNPRSWMILGISTALFAALTLVALPPSALAQSTISTGSIQGTVTDPSGAALSGAKVTITDQATGKSESLTTNSAGVYNSGPLLPGTYKVGVTGAGFRTTTGVITVLVGNSASFNTRLQLGQESQTVEVQATEVQVNTNRRQFRGY